MRSVADLAPDDRGAPIVSVLRPRRRSWRGWLVLAALVALNEARGLAVAGAVLKALHWR